MVFLVLLLAFGLILRPLSAHAAIGGIGNAQVDEGAFTVHLRNAYTVDEESNRLNDRWRQRLMTDYGVNDWFATGLYLQGERLQSDDAELEAIIWENRFEFTNAAQHGYYSGIRLRYTWKDGDQKPDDAHIRLIIGAPVGAWDLRFNQIIGVETGQESVNGILWDSRAQATYSYHGAHRAGLEWFGNFGNLDNAGSFDEQQHEVGPVFQGPVTENVNYEAGYRYGISERAADHTLRVFLIRRF